MAAYNTGGYPAGPGQDYSRDYRNDPAFQTRAFADGRGYQEYSNDPRDYRDSVGYAPDPRAYQDSRGYADPQHIPREQLQYSSDPRSMQGYPDQRDSQGYRDQRDGYSDQRGYPDQRDGYPDQRDMRSYADPRGYPDQRDARRYSESRGYSEPQGYAESRDYRESRGNQDTRGYQDTRSYQDPQRYEDGRSSRGYQNSRSAVWEEPPAYRDSREQPDPRGRQDPRGQGNDYARSDNARDEYPPQDRGASRSSAGDTRSYSRTSADEQRGYVDLDKYVSRQQGESQNRHNSRNSEEGEYANGGGNDNYSASSSMPPSQLFGPTVVKESKEVEAVQELEGKTVGIYFASARDRESTSFLPYLIKAYQGALVSMNVEIVWVPIDTDQREFMQVARRIPWLALPRDAASSAIGRRLVRKCRQEQVPHLVFIDQYGRLLSREGIKRIRSDKTCKKFPWTNKTFGDAIGTEFLRGREMVTIDSFEGKLIGILFASEEQASVWYGPGNSFASTLAKQYKAALRRGHEFEVVFCSADGSQKAFNRQYKEIVDNTNPPWLAIPFADSGRRKALAFTLRVSKSPQLVIVDSDGRILNGDAVSDVSRDPQGSKFPWARQLVRELKSGWDSGPRFTAIVCCLIESFPLSQQEDITAQLETVSQRYHDAVHENNEEHMYTFFAARRNSEEAARLRQICKLPRASYAAPTDKEHRNGSVAYHGFVDGFTSGITSGMPLQMREKLGIHEHPDPGNGQESVPETQQSLPPLDRMPPTDRELPTEGGTQIEEWKVELDRSSGGQLGIAMNTTSLRIDRVVDTGLVTDWNNSNPDRRVLAGDQVLEVNGKSDPKEVIMECKKGQVLVFRLQRQAVAPRTAEDKTEVSEDRREVSENKEMMPKAWLVFLEVRETHINYSTLETQISAESVEEFIEDVEAGRVRSSKLKREQAGIPAYGDSQNAAACRTCTKFEWMSALLGGGTQRRSRSGPKRSRSKSRDRAKGDEWGLGGLLG